MRFTSESPNEGGNQGPLYRDLAMASQLREVPRQARVSQRRSEAPERDPLILKLAGKAPSNGT